jgi:hypothetical protein
MRGQRTRREVGELLTYAILQVARPSLIAYVQPLAEGSERGDQRHQPPEREEAPPPTQRQRRTWNVRTRRRGEGQAYDHTIMISSPGILSSPAGPDFLPHDHLVDVEGDDLHAARQRVSYHQRRHVYCHSPPSMHSLCIAPSHPVCTTSSEGQMTPGPPRTHAGPDEGSVLDEDVDHPQETADPRGRIWPHTPLTQRSAPSPPRHMKLGTWFRGERDGSRDVGNGQHQDEPGI